MEGAHQLARKHLKQATERQRRGYDNKVRGAPFKPGDLCWVAIKAGKTGVSPKLRTKWRGPAVVTRVYNDVTLEVQVGPAKYVTVHSDMVKQSHSLKRPTWLRTALRQLQVQLTTEAAVAEPRDVQTQTDLAQEPEPSTPAPAPEGGTPAVEALPRPTTHTQTSPASGPVAPGRDQRDSRPTPADPGPAAPPRPVPAPRRRPRPASPTPTTQDPAKTADSSPQATSGPPRPTPAPRTRLPGQALAPTPPAASHPAPLSQAPGGPVAHTHPKQPNIHRRLGAAGDVHGPQLVDNIPAAPAARLQAVPQQLC